MWFGIAIRVLLLIVAVCLVTVLSGSLLFVSVFGCVFVCFSCLGCFLVLLFGYWIWFAVYCGFDYLIVLCLLLRIWLFGCFVSFFGLFDLVNSVEWFYVYRCCLFAANFTFNGV